MFRFCIRNANPELWRTTLPLIVRMRCGRHKGLIATWTAIHWLIVLYAASGRRAFGVREIAQEAGVGRNELAGPDGYIQRLVDLGLLRIVGHEHVPGLRDRPVYAIDLWDLERESMTLIPEILRAEGLPPPPRPAPDPRQLSFLSTIGVAPESGTDAPPPPPAFRPAPPENGTARAGGSPPAYRFSPAMHGNGTVAPENGTGRAPQTHQPSLTGTAPLETGTAPLETGTALHKTTPGWPETRPADAPKRDIERGEEIERIEGGREAAPAPLITLITNTVQRTILEILGSMGITAPTGLQAAEASPMPGPSDQPPITRSLPELWGADRDQVRQRDIHQLELLAGTYNAATGGYGAYWVGRAILMAEGCLEGRGQRPSIGYLKAVLRRWHVEGRWGSDLDLPAGEEPAPPLPAPSAARPEPPAAAPAPADRAHPAVQAYAETMREAPNAVQAQQIAAQVADLSIWRQVLSDWQLNGWGERSVGKMLDRYQKAAGAAPGAPGDPAAAPVSVAAIHTYPGLTDEQRDRWIHRFHAATSPAEKRAVIARMEAEGGRQTSDVRRAGQEAP